LRAGLPTKQNLKPLGPQKKKKKKKKKMLGQTMVNTQTADGTPKTVSGICNI
jgi:hypothetical protein